MESFATIEDLEKRYRTLTDEEKTIAETLLMDATLKILIKVPSVEDTEDEKIIYARKVVCVSMVRRAFAAIQADNIGVTSATTQAGSFMQTFSYSSMAGELYITDEELNMLLGGSSIANFLSPYNRGHAMSGKYLNN